PVAVRSIFRRLIRSRWSELSGQGDMPVDEIQGRSRTTTLFMRHASFRAIDDLRRSPLTMHESPLRWTKEDCVWSPSVFKAS
ncbi:hypothetical protein PMAYCL1PPCAC_07728, partial [Pristionchus mayeri]